MKAWFDRLLIISGILIVAISAFAIVEEAAEEDISILIYITGNLPGSLLLVGSFLVGIIFLVLGGI